MTNGPTTFPPPRMNSQMTTLQQENSALHKEISHLRLQLIRNDDLCDEKLRKALAESRELRRDVSELKFGKEQATQCNMFLERPHDEIQSRLITISSICTQNAISTEQDTKARMELAAMLSTAKSEDDTTINVLNTGADRAGPLHERLAGRTETWRAANIQNDKKYCSRAEQVETALSNFREGASNSKPRLTTDTLEDMKSCALDCALSCNLLDEGGARNRTEASLEAAEAASAAALITADEALSDAQKSYLYPQTSIAERDKGCLIAKDVAEESHREREKLQAEIEATVADLRDVSCANEKVDKLKTLLRGLEATRVDLIAKLGEVQAQTREAKNQAGSSNELTPAERARADEVTAEITRGSATIKILDNEKDFIEAQLDARSEELAAANQRILRQSEAVEDARQAVADAEARCLAAADETAHTFHRLCIANKTILEMSFAEKEFRADAHIHDQELKAVGEDLATLTREQQKMNAELVKFAIERDLAISALNEMNVSKVEMDTSVKAAKKELEDFVVAYQELGTENRRLIAAVSALERDSQRAKMAQVISEAALDKAFTRIKMLEEQNSQFIIEIQAFERQVENLSRSLTDSKLNGIGANQEISDLHDRLAASHALAMELGRAREQTQRELVAAESSLHVMRKRLTYSQDECDTISLRLRIASDRVRELETLLADTRAKEHRRDISSLDADRHVSQTTEKEDHVDVGEHVSDQCIAGRLKELKQENFSLRSHLAGTEEACEKMEKELKRIQKEYNDLAGSLSGSLDGDVMDAYRMS